MTLYNDRILRRHFNEKVIYLDRMSNWHLLKAAELVCFLIRLRAALLLPLIAYM